MPKIEHKSPEPMPESKKDKIAQPNEQYPPVQEQQIPSIELPLNFLLH